MAAVDEISVCYTGSRVHKVVVTDTDTWGNFKERVAAFTEESGEFTFGGIKLPFEDSLPMSEILASCGCLDGICYKPPVSDAEKKAALACAKKILD